MLKTLIKKQFLELFRGIFINHKNGKARTGIKLVGYIVLYVSLFITLGTSFYVIDLALSDAMLNQGCNWLYFAITGLITIALGVLGSAFSTYGVVYLPKDNDAMLSLPIPTTQLLISRLVGVYGISLLYGGLMWVPSVLCYWNAVDSNLTNILLPILLSFVIALLVTVLSCLLGWVIALLAKRMKGKSILNVLIALLAIGVYYVAYYKAMHYLSEIVLHLEQLKQIMSSALFIFCLLGKAADGDVSAMLMFAGITFLLAVICVYVLSKTFMRLVSTKETIGKSGKIKLEYESHPIQSVLLKRELQHFTSISTWMLNGGFGLVVLIAGAVGLLAKKGDISNFLSQMQQQMPNFQSLLPIFTVAIICSIVSTIDLTPVSISIEGKNMWILQSLPLEQWLILKTKEKMAFYLMAGAAIIPTGIASILFEFNGLQAILTIVAVCLYALWLSDFGLFLNLKQPNLTWQNATFLVKQSMPVIISMFAGWLISAGIGFGGYFLGNWLSAEVVLLVIILVLTVVRTILYSWLKTKGAKILTQI